MSRVHFRAPAEEALLLCVFYAQSHQLQAIETMSLSSLTFKKNDRVEALWLEDGKWYAAEVIQVKPHNLYRIRFDGFVEEYDRNKMDLRVLEQGGGAAARRPPSKEVKAAPAPAPAPPSVDSKHKEGSSDGKLG